DTLVDICYRSWISAGKEVDIRLDEGRDKPLRPTYMLLYSWDGGLEVCVDLTGSSPLTQTGMGDFVPGQAMIDATQRKRGKYMAKCAAIGSGFLCFSFSSLGEFEANVFGVGVSGGGEVILHVVNHLIEVCGDDVGLSMLLVDSKNAFNLVDRAVMLQEVFEMTQCSFDAALYSALNHIVTAYGHGFGDWQWRLTTLPFAFGGLDVYYAGEVLNYAFLASRFLLACRLSCFDILKSCSACSRVFTGDIYKDHFVSCADIIGIKHRQNIVRDTLVDLCFRLGIPVSKEVDIGLGGGHDKPLRTVDMMVDFVPVCATDASQRKRVKYETKCSDIANGFLPFFIFFAWGIREGCDDFTEADPIVLRDS
nr:hypothetical protein [Tanacetum cinerariifolium]